jgi:hypothetical protein
MRKWEKEGARLTARGKKKVRGWEGEKMAAIRLVLTFTFNLYPLACTIDPSFMFNRGTFAFS